MFRTHPAKGKRILEPIPSMGELIPGAWCHHENFDGSGYPRGLMGDNIPILGRVVAVADTYDAMTSDRAYRKALPHEVAVAELERCAGAQFDPELVPRSSQDRRKTPARGRKQQKNRAPPLPTHLPVRRRAGAELRAVWGAATGPAPAAPRAPPRCLGGPPLLGCGGLGSRVAGGRGSPRARGGTGQGGGGGRGGGEGGGDRRPPPVARGRARPTRAPRTIGHAARARRRIRPPPPPPEKPLRAPCARSPAESARPPDRDRAARRAPPDDQAAHVRGVVGAERRTGGQHQHRPRQHRVAKPPPVRAAHRLPSDDARKDQRADRAGRAGRRHRPRPMPRKRQR